MMAATSAENELTLLIDVLPAFLTIATAMQKEHGDANDHRSRYYHRLNATIWMVQLELPELQSRPPAWCTSATTDILDQLETSLHGASVAMLSKYSSQSDHHSPYPKLRALSLCQEIVTPQELYTTWGSVDFGTLRCREALLASLRDFTAQLARTISDPTTWKDYDLPAIRKEEPPYEIRSIVGSVHETLVRVAGACPCPCPNTLHLQEEHHGYTAKLPLETFRSHQQSDGSLELDLCLSMDQPTKWHRTTIRSAPKLMNLECQKTPAQTHLVRASMSSTRRTRPPSQPVLVEFLCVPIRRAQTPLLLRLLVDKDGLWKEQSSLPKERMPVHITQGTPISLREIISSGRFLSDLVKRMTAVLLAYAALFLDDWLSHSWSSADVHFHQFGSDIIPLQPYIVTRLEAQNGHGGHHESHDSDPDDAQLHQYPGLVALAIMLMEFAAGKPVELFVEIDEVSITTNVNTRYFIALHAFEMLEETMNVFVRDVVKRCLDVDFGLVEDELMDRDDFDRAIYRDIISPLEQDLGNHGERYVHEIDELAPKMDLGHLGRILSTDWMRPEPRNQSLDRTQSGTTCNQKRPVCGKYFDDELSGEILNVGLSTNWMKRLCITCEQMIHQDGAHHGVRIAILDSGIDINHPDIIAREERIRDVRSWVNGLNGESAWKDGDILGHGTHTTSLLLDCAPQHAGIYVARVASTDLSDASQIAKAIRFALNNWKVDMISMSFGYPDKGKGYEELWNAIQDANNEGVTIFAAASNEGGNRVRAFPARHDEVICVHSTDARGNPSSFNPTRKHNSDNFSTLGEDLESAWPANLQGKAKDIASGPVKIKSGTSFATPIATGMAAFVLQYARQKLPDLEVIRERHRHTPKAMRAMLRVVAARSGERKGFDYLTIDSSSRDSFFGMDEAHIVSSLRDAVMTCA